MAKKENITEAEVTPEQIAEWKKKYGEVHLIEVAIDPEVNNAGVLPTELDDLPTYKAYLKKPERKVMNLALVTMPRNMIQAGKIIVQNCWLGGDIQIKETEGYADQCALQAIELVEIYQTRIKKL